MDEENEEQEQKKNPIIEEAKAQAEQYAKQQIKQVVQKALKEAAKKIAEAAAKALASLASNPYVWLAIGIIVLIILIIVGICYLIDNQTVAEAAELMQGDMSQYVSIEDGHFQIDESIYDAFMERMDAQGLDGGEYLQKDSKYLKAIIKAELATTYPKLKNEDTDLEGDSFQGIVEIIRRSYEAEDGKTYYNGGEDKEVLLEYMEPEEFDKKVKDLQEGFDNDDYEELKKYYTIGGENTGGSSGNGGSDATGSYNGAEIKYDSTFATLNKSPEELNLNTETKSNVRTTVYGAGAAENGGYEGQTASGVDLEEGRHIVAVGTVNPIASIGDWVYLKGKPELGYFLVCDTGAGDQNWDSWMDIFNIQSDAAQNQYGDYNDVQVIKKADADAFIASGYTRDDSTAGTTNNSNSSNSSSSNTGSSIVIKIPTYNGTSVGTEKISYQNSVSKYSVPVEFLISQLKVTDNPEYIYSLADMVINNSKIELVIQDTYSYTYTHTVVNEMQTYTDESTGEEKTKLVTVTDKESESEIIGIMKYIREVDTWIVNVTQEYKKTDTRYKEEGYISYKDEGTFTYTKKGQVSFSGTPGVSDEGDTSLADTATKGIAQDIPESVKEKMQGRSMVDNSNIGYEDLKYLTIPYIDFNGNRKVGHMVVAKDLADEVLDIFEELYNIGYPIEKMELVDNYYSGTRSGTDDAGSDYASIEDNNTSAFNYRLSTAGGGSVSKHGLGRAIDINPKINPWVDSDGTGAHSNASRFWNRSDANRATWSEVEQKAYIGPGTEIYNIFVNRGWTWGGSWSDYLDYQHFEK